MNIFINFFILLLIVGNSLFAQDSKLDKIIEKGTLKFT